ncbi:MAG: guanylate kinase [Deltaproteobacteria bacterium]|nr:guanylate kinase [Deltaproteobacteria bacterium]
MSYKTGENKREGRLIIISAPSGTGKTTVCERLLKLLPNALRSISYTTRPMRSEEVDGVSYFFVSEERFEDLKRQGALAEWAVVHGSQYGTSVEFVQRALKQGQDVLFNIDVQGARQLKRKFPQAITIFLLPPSMEELERRLRGRRTESEEALKIRLQRAEKEMAEADNYDSVVTNDSLERAVNKILVLLEKKAHS